MSPYQKLLKDLKERGLSITLNRADAPDVIGDIKSVDNDGCTILTNAPAPPGAAQSVFVAYRDIRGVASTDWDPELL